MSHQYTESQRTLLDSLDVGHITVSIPVENGEIAIGFSVEVVDPAGQMIHLESWSRGSFTSDLHCLFTLALTIRSILEAAGTSS